MWNKMLCKNSSNINIGFHRCGFDKNVTRMLQQEGILTVLKKKIRRKMSWNFVTSHYYWKSMKLVASINSHISCMSWYYTCKKSSSSVQRLFVKTLRSDRRSLQSENWKLNKVLIRWYKSILEQSLQINFVTYYLSTPEIFPLHFEFQNDISFKWYLF